MSDLYYPLNIPYEPLQSGYVYPTFNSKLPHLPKVMENEEFLNPNLVSWFASIGVNLSRCHLFVLRGQGKSIIHKDGQKGGRNPVWAINWILDGHYTHMRWYDLKPEYKGFEPIKRDAENANNGGAGGEQYPPEVVECIDEVLFSGPMLVRVDLPHDVINESPMDRWCVSVREGNGRPWDEIVNVMKPFMY